MKNVEPGYFVLRPPIVLTSTDHDLLIALLRDSSSTLEPEAARFLREELDRADIAPDEASGMMVSMGCEVKFIDHHEQRVRSGRLVYPHEVENSDCISVVSPLGSALIGLGPGQSICWDHRGIERTITVLEVRAAGSVGKRQSHGRMARPEPGRSSCCDRKSR